MTLQKDIVKSTIIDDALKEKVDEYTKFVTDQKRGALTEYVTRRRAVIDLFEKFLEYKDGEKQNYQKEDVIHRLICPMRVDSSSLEIEDHNLWLLDDRLAFYHFFASDKPIQSYTAVDEKDRPDLAFFYDTCVAWREDEYCDTVMLGGIQEADARRLYVRSRPCAANSTLHETTTNRERCFRHKGARHSCKWHRHSISLLCHCRPHANTGSKHYWSLQPNAGWLWIFWIFS